MIEITHAMYVDVLDISFVVRDLNIIKIGLKSGGELRLTCRYDEEDKTSLVLTRDVSDRRFSRADIEIALDEFTRLVELIKLEKFNLIKSLIKE